MDIKDFEWINETSLKFLERDYLLEGQSFTDRVQIIVDTFESYVGKEIAEKFLTYFKKGWYSLSTPIWTNYGTDRGLPISCYGTYVGDSMPSILAGISEVGMMSKLGGGTSGYFGDLRPRGAEIKNNGQSSGPYGFMQLYDLESTVISQGKTRRGSFAAYMPIDHEDIMEFLAIRSEGNKIQDLSFAVCVPDYWLEEMEAGDEEKRKVWAKVLEIRYNTGYPYIFFTDNVNKGKPKIYHDLNMPIKASNLCTEIALPSNDIESFICCVASMNCIYYDDWEKTDAVRIFMMFLDTTLTEFIKRAIGIPYMERAIRFAERHRAIGLGLLGYHSYLQKNMIPFESMTAKFRTSIIFQHLQKETTEASKEMAVLWGEPELLKGYGLRNTCTMAIAPTKSSSFILGQASEGIEPNRSNVIIKDLAKIKVTHKNPYLKTLLNSLDQNTDDIWQSIMINGGSVQHLDFLSDNEKKVFKTFQEINPSEIIIQASIRQKFIDQAQSLNLMIPPTMPAKALNKLILEAWRLGIKTLYYQYSVNAAQEFSRDLLQCVSCEA